MADDRVIETRADRRRKDAEGILERRADYVLVSNAMQFAFSVAMMGAL
jgi:hypothetical protein